MYIGNVKLDNNVFLAPMAGVTDMPLGFCARNKVRTCIYRNGKCKEFIITMKEAIN